MQLGPHSLVKKGKLVDYQPPFKTFNQFLQNLAEKLGDKPAVIFEDFITGQTLSLSYQELNHFTLKLATSLLKEYQLSPGQRFSFAFENTPEILLLNYAAWRAGLVSVPLDVKRDTLERKIYKLKFTNSKLLFTRSALDTKKENQQISKALPQLKIIEVKDFADFKKKLISQSSPLHPPTQPGSLPPSPRPNSDCLILFTSGTTALPKGTRLTLKSLFANAASIADWLKFNSQDRFHVLLPLHHINSTTFVNTTLASSATVILSPRYSKSQFWSVCAKHKATGASIVPTIAYDLLSETSSFKNHQQHLKQVRRIQIGSAPVQPQVVEKFMALYNIPLIQGYGQTETSLRSAGVPMDLTNNQAAYIRKVNSLGTELKYTNVTILDKAGKELGEDQEGEICVRGPIIMPGYLKNPTANKEAFEFNWFHSGDTGYFKKIFGRKFFFIKGRTKEIIKKGGILISPLAIENALLARYRKLEKIYVVGFPDPRLGQEIGFVAVSEKAEEVEKILQDAKRGKIDSLSNYELPRAGLRVKDKDLPKTSTGKIQRIKIRERFADKLLEQYRTIAQTQKLTLRLIGAEESQAIKSAVAINNLRWGKGLKASQKEFRARAQNGLLIGAFNSKNHVLGTVSAIRINQTDLAKTWTQTWNGISANGTLSSHNHKGDSLLCVAISVTPHKKTNRQKDKQTPKNKKQLTSQSLKTYLNSDTDPVMRFHRQPKAGLKTGAKIVRILKAGRPQDKDALGYNILMQYPTPKKAPTINPHATTGTQLIEAALLYAFEKKLKNIYVYSRPAALSQHFKA